MLFDKDIFYVQQESLIALCCSSCIQKRPKSSLMIYSYHEHGVYHLIAQLQDCNNDEEVGVEEDGEDAVDSIVLDVENANDLYGVGLYYLLVMKDTRTLLMLLHVVVCSV